MSDSAGIDKQIKLETDSLTTGQCSGHSSSLSGRLYSSTDEFQIKTYLPISPDKKPYPVTRDQRIGYETNQIKYETISFVPTPK